MNETLKNSRPSENGSTDSTETSLSTEPDSNPIEELEELLKQDWGDRGSQIQVIVNNAQERQPRSLFPPQLDPRSPTARWVATITLILSALAGLAKLIIDLWS